MKIDPRNIDLDNLDDDAVPLPKFEKRKPKISEGENDYVPVPKRDIDKARRLRKIARKMKGAPDEVTE